MVSPKNLTTDTEHCLVPVILSGGTGSRLWPLSRSAHPKPFIPLPDGETLFEKTIKRVQHLEGSRKILTVTNRGYYFLTRDAVSQCYAEIDPEGPQMAYLLEPKARNTAPAMAAAAFWAQEQAGDDAILLFLPSDHLIGKGDVFRTAVAQAAALATEGFLVTFGIQPSHAETGYGYICAGEALDHGGRRVQRFVEKPDAITAQSYFDSGNYTWNSGMFCMRADVFLRQLAAHAPEVAAAAQQAWLGSKQNGDTWELGEAFQNAPDLSIDYALFEHAEDVAVVPVDFSWNDLGAWRSYGELLDCDGNDNQILGRDVLVEDSRGCIVHSPNRLAALLGVEDLMIIDTPDALLVARKDRDQDVKRIVSRLKSQRKDLIESHVTVHRPWGTFTTLEEGDHFKIKRIVVKPGEKLSLQMHHHRSEHWVVVRGTAKIVNGQEERLVMTNESTFIPAGQAHRLENPGVLPLVLIEVQSGEYLGEDDIVRFDDIYGRASVPVPVTNE